MGSIVVTGLGVVSPIGIGVDNFFRNLCNGKSGIDKITLFDISKYKKQLGAEIKEIEPSGDISRAFVFADMVCREALNDSGYTDLPDLHRKVGLVMGTMFGGMDLYENIKFRKKIDDTLTNQKAFLNYPLQAVGNYLASEFKICGTTTTLSNACATGTHILGWGQYLINTRQADMVICCGVDSMTELNFASFLPFRVMATSRISPFDKNREGTIIGEGAGCIVLENMEHAIKRGAKIYCELAGYGTSCDAFDMVGMDENAGGLTHSINEALKNAGLDTSQVDYINAHGTGTRTNDKLETLAIKKVFRESAYHISVSSSKSMIGHCLGAAGIIEAAVCVLSMQSNLVPPTINYTDKDPDCDLDYTPNYARRRMLNVTMSNSFGFGGNNSCVVFKK